MRWYTVSYKPKGGWWIKDTIDNLPSRALICILRRQPDNTKVNLEDIRTQVRIELYIREHNLRG